MKMKKKTGRSMTENWGAAGGKATLLKVVMFIIILMLLLMLARTGELLGGIDSIAVSLFGNMTVEPREIHIITKE